jgi:hypothetical protein
MAGFICHRVPILAHLWAASRQDSFEPWPAQKGRRGRAEPKANRAARERAPGATMIAPALAEGVRPKRQRNKDSMGKRPPDTEPAGDAPEVGGVPGAAGRAEALRIVAPGTAAKDTGTAAISAGPCRTVWGRSVIVGMIAILHPLEHVTRHVVEAERVGLERADRRGLAVIPLAAAAIAVGIFLADLVTPVIGRRGACLSSRCIGSIIDA